MGTAVGQSREYECQRKTGEEGEAAKISCVERKRRERIECQRQKYQRQHLRVIGFQRGIDGFQTIGEDQTDNQSHRGDQEIDAVESLAVADLLTVHHRGKQSTGSQNGNGTEDQLGSRSKALDGVFHNGSVRIGSAFQLHQKIVQREIFIQVGQTGQGNQKDADDRKKEVGVVVGGEERREILIFVCRQFAGEDEKTCSHQNQEKDQCNARNIAGNR